MSFWHLDILQMSTLKNMSCKHQINEFGGCSLKALGWDTFLNFDSEEEAV